MSERLKEHDWKSCVRPQRCTAGSNPALSARNQGIRSVILAFCPQKAKGSGRFSDRKDGRAPCDGGL